MIIAPITNDDNINHIYDRPYVYEGDSSYYGGHDLPPYTISLDVEPEIVCIDLPKVVKYNGLERYKLEHTKVRAFRFYCLHKEDEKPSGNGTKEKPWNNFYSALQKLHPLCEGLCADYVQLIILPDSDMVTYGEEEGQEYYLEYVSHKNLIIGSLEGDTLCKITLVIDTDRGRDDYYYCIFSQCDIYLKNKKGDYQGGAIFLKNIHRCILHCKNARVEHVTDSTIYFESTIVSEFVDVNALAIIYNSKLEHTGKETDGYALCIAAIINSTVNLGYFNNEPIVLNLINSKLNGTCTSHDDFHIDHIYKSNIELIDTRIKDIRTIIDSTINIKSRRSNCIRLSGGCNDKEMLTLGAFAIISNVKINYTFTPKIGYEYDTPCYTGGYGQWGALVFSLKIDASSLCNPVVVSSCDCNVSIQGPPDAETNIENIWYCVFPPNCGLPSQCHVIKGKICDIRCFVQI